MEITCWELKHFRIVWKILYFPSQKLVLWKIFFLKISAVLKIIQLVLKLSRYHDIHIYQSYILMEVIYIYIDNIVYVETNVSCQDPYTILWGTFRRTPKKIKMLNIVLITKRNTLLHCSVFFPIFFISKLWWMFFLKRKN